MIQFKSLIFDSKPCKILTIRDMTHFYKFEQVNHQKNLITTLNTTVSHEMLTPLNCIIAIADYLTENIKN